VVMHRRTVVRVHYVVWPMVEAWRAAGHDVDVLLGPDRRAVRRADLVLLHVDRTVVPAAYRRAIRGHPRVLNGGVLDISKRAISRQAVRPGDGWSGAVVVKSDRNAGGIPEVTWPAWRRRLSDLRRDTFGIAWCDALPAAEYRVYERADDVPPRIFRNRNLFVERFVPERDGDLYCLNYYTFFGDREICTRYKAPSPIVKRKAAVSVEEIAVPDAIRAIRRQLGFDYGKFDYVVHDGEIVLLDANRTPAVSRNPDEQRRQGSLLAPGLEAFLDRPSQVPVA